MAVVENTERKGSEEALQASEAHYRYLFEHNPVPMLIYATDDLLLLAVNDAFSALYGYGQEEVRSMHLADIYPDFEKEAITELSKKLRGHVFAGEWHHRKKDGTIIAIEAHSHGFTFAGRMARIEVITDITERINAEEALRQSMSKFRTLFEINPDAIFITDPESQEIIDCNEVACTMNGYSREELIGKNINILHLADTTTNVEALEERRQFVDHLRWNGSVTIESVHKRKDQTVFPIETSMCLLHLGDRVFVMGIDRDITERKLAEERLQKYSEGLEEMVKERTGELVVAKERAESADRLKSAFLATMSHELRTPLNSILGFTGILLQGLAGQLNPEQAKQLGMVQKSASHLRALINDILDLSKIEAGELDVYMNEFNIRQSIEKVTSSFRPIVERKGLEMHVSIPSDVQNIVSDMRRVEQILLNLLNNAVKFTERGSVSVDCRIVDKSLRMSIADTGIGINAEDMDKLFLPFSQIESGISRTHEGTGLGLSICKKLADKLNGKITVQSMIGTGSTFTVELPYS
ncbi:MAG TPA: PAS domain S-box protein [Bacteroidota bacterium]|nr:PAS domain S-box protein [Bacteroidota bacterium]